VRGERPTRIELPTSIVWTAFFAGQSARTSALRARVDAAAARDPSPVDRAIEALASASAAALAACRADDSARFVEAARATGRALADLGRISDAPIVTAEAAELARLAESDGAAFLPSGAGGGDCAIFVGTSEPSSSFVDRAARLSFTRLSLALDRDGVKVVS